MEEYSIIIRIRGEEVEKTVPLVSLPPDFFFWIDHDGKVIFPQDGVPHLLGKNYKYLRDEDGCQVAYGEIESARLVKDMRQDLSLSFFNMSLEELEKKMNQT